LNRLSRVFAYNTLCEVYFIKSIYGVSLFWLSNFIFYNKLKGITNWLIYFFADLLVLLALDFEFFVRKCNRYVYDYGWRGSVGYKDCDLDE